MSFADDIKSVLEIEREGKRRLAETQEEAARLVDNAREEGRLMLEEAERGLSAERAERTAAMQSEIAEEVKSLELRSRNEEERLRRLAARNRDAAVEQILGWLRGEV
jgi:F0F1-type ATP synthase membrane subunit b/b'